MRILWLCLTAGLSAAVAGNSGLELEIVRSVKLSFPTEAGKRYRILTSTDVDFGEWAASGDPIEGDGHVYTVHRDSEAPGPLFFKVEEILPPADAFTVAGLGMKMIPIPAGTFVMGSASHEEDRSSDEGPLTGVTISDPYWMGETEVTQGQWEAVMGDNPSEFQGGPNFPVEQVSWNRAVEFCVRLTAREAEAGRLPEGYRFSLPTEAQWERACRAGAQTRFYYGDDPEYVQLEDHAWYNKNSGGRTHPVGEKQPNSWGLYDIYGNVSEFCLDWYGGYPGGAVVDPDGPLSGEFRAIRGNSVRSRNAGACRSAKRLRTTPVRTFQHVGLRAALIPVH